MARPLRRLSSPRLTLFLLLSLAVLGALGTAIPQGLAPEAYLQRFPRAGSWVLALGMDRFFAGPLYRGLLAGLCMNLAACTLGRLARGWGGLVGGRAVRWSLGEGERPERLAWLQARRFVILRRRPLRAVRSPWAVAGFLLVHLSPLPIAAGGLAGSLFGYVGTATVHVGGRLDTVYNWESRSDERLPFVATVEELTETHYPLQLRLEVEDAAGRSLPLETRVGQETAVPGTPFRLQVLAFDPADGSLRYRLRGPDGEDGPFAGGRDPASPVVVRPTEYRDPQVRSVRSRLVVEFPDRPPVRADVSINAPLVVGGLRVYLTAWGRDRYGFPYAGFQVVRDPGQPLVWAGAAGLGLGLPLLWLGPGGWAEERRGRLLVRGRRLAVCPPPPAPSGVECPAVPKGETARVS
ncbi:MAG: hypothetical protein Kow0092_18340 [Deferrisomatales bacterium]